MTLNTMVRRTAGVGSCEQNTCAAVVVAAAAACSSASKVQADTTEAAIAASRGDAGVAW